MHVSDVPESQYLEAKIISAQPYYPPTEELSISSDLARFRSLVQAQEGRQSTLGSSNGEKVSRKQTAGDRGADESPTRGTQNEAVPIEISGALGTLVLGPRIIFDSGLISMSNCVCLSSVSLYEFYVAIHF